jgi:hypothetical protein
MPDTIGRHVNLQMAVIMRSDASSCLLLLLLLLLLPSPATPVALQINTWVAAKLQGLGNVSDIGEAINETFPRCVSKCCRPENHRDTSLSLPTPVCSKGTVMNNLLGLCVGGDMGYAPCPDGFSRCMLPSGAPLCLAEDKVLGMDSCKVAGALMHNLPKVQCPADAADGTGKDASAVLDNTQAAVEANTTGPYVN